MFQPVLKTVEVPELQYFQGGRCPYCCSSSTRCGRPCDYAGTCLAVGGATDSVHRLIWWTPRQVSQLGAMMGFFDAFCVIFRAPPVVPELSASRSWRALDDEEFFVIEGSPGCRSRREFHSQVTWHPDCQLDRSVVST